MRLSPLLIEDFGWKAAVVREFRLSTRRSYAERNTWPGRAPVNLPSLSITWPLTIE